MNIREMGLERNNKGQGRVVKWRRPSRWCVAGPTMDAQGNN